MESTLYFVWLANRNYFSCCSWLMLKAHFNLWLSKIFCCPQEEGSFLVRIVLCCAWNQKEYCKLEIPLLPKRSQARAASAPVCKSDTCRAGGEMGTPSSLKQHLNKLRSLPLFCSSTGMCFGQLQKFLSWFLPWLAWRVISRWHWHPGSPLLWVLTRWFVCVGMVGISRRHQEILLLYNHLCVWDVPFSAK